MNFSRRTLLKASAAATVMGSVGSPLVARAQQAEFVYKYANNLPDTHPMNVRAKEMSAAIKQETNGRVDLQIFPNNQLGSDTDVLSQIRSGGLVRAPWKSSSRLFTKRTGRSTRTSGPSARSCEE